MSDLKYYRNNGLFSDHYLEGILQNRKIELVGESFTQAQYAYDQIKALRDSVNPASLNEAQLEEQWIKPIFDILGLHYAVQISIRYREKGQRKPDYLLLASEEEANALTSERYSPEQISHALAIADAKKWGTNLDQSAQNLRNPAQQIDEYLRYSELSWGILTDGRYWRLYHYDTSKYNLYYVVDLDEILRENLFNFNQDNRINDFMYFYMFFRKEAFAKLGWLDQILASSQLFAQDLSDTLEVQVYEALELIAQGFLEYRRNNLQPDVETLNLIFDQSLILLYRLLFIFYAESRHILPINKNTYYEKNYSLRAIISSNQKQKLVSPMRNSATVYHRLADLFHFIDRGYQDIDMPEYNGKLFSASEHPFLKEKIVGDLYIIPALRKLALVGAGVDDQSDKELDGSRYKTVDYRDLSVRHLGSIYEKLLEYELHIATEPLADKGGKYVPTTDPAKAIKQISQVYLKTDNNERTVTGSYYTPDYIVRFIVEKTIEPVLEDITSRHATRDADGHWQVHNPQALKNDILGINVLDPATGSGHFIVDATAYIAEWLTGLALNPDELGDEDELIYWKRQVAGSCIYAVDINPLAVELAKLSMWLTTLAQGKPLSFLNHHLRAGNSLVGASLFTITDQLTPLEADNADETTPNLTMDAQFVDHVGQAVRHMDTIETTIPDNIQSVKQQEKLYAQLSQQLYAWRDVADVWTARDFGLALTDEQWKTIRKRKDNAKVTPIIQQAQQIAKQHRFFYWELAFPEVFFEADGTPKPKAGFDAVIGNPPYVRQERIVPIKPYLERHYQVYTGSADLFLYFYEKGLTFLKQGGRLGYITSGTYMNSNSAKPFRQYIHEQAGLEWMVNFGENQPFQKAEMVYPTIAILRRGEKRETFKHLFMEGTIPFEQLPETLLEPVWQDSLSDVTSMAEWRFQPAELTHLFKKVTEGYQTLDEAVGGRIYYGIKTGFNEAFIINGETKERLIAEHPSSAEIIKPMLRGEDLRPWFQRQNNLFLIFTNRGVDIEQYPAILKYLENFRPRLEPKPANWKGGQWGGRASGTYKWYELQGGISYEQAFKDEKILVPDIANFPRSSWDSSGYYSNDKGTVVSATSKSILAILNSRVSWFTLSQIATPLRLRGGLWQYQAKIQFVERLPIPDLTPDQERELSQLAEHLTQLARERYQLHENFRQTILNEFKGDSINTQVKLYQWWELADEGALSDQIRRQFGKDIPLKKRGEWRDYLAQSKANHQRLTDQIIQQETRMNDIVYDVFNLTPEERVLIEQATKYPYGEV